MVCVVLLAALALSVAGLLLPAGVRAGAPDPTPARFGAAVTAVLLAQVMQLRFRVGPSVVGIAWGEAAVVVCLYLVPPGWLPAAVFAGALVGRLLYSAFSDGVGVVPPYALVHIAALLCVGAAAAAAVVAALADPYDAALSPALACTLALGALVYIVGTLALTALTALVRYRLPFAGTFLHSVRTKTLMFVGNVVVSLVIVGLVRVDPWWLVLLPPAMWLLQQTYADRLRVSAERRTWQAFASVTRALNQLDERGVAAAGIEGANLLFAPQRVEVEVLRPDGSRHLYSADRSGGLVESTAAPEAGGPRDLDRSASRALVVGGVQVGDLRLSFARPGALQPQEEMALSAFSDALAAALHDAATHHELSVVAARRLHEAMHDPLTGLVNRSALLAKGDGALRMLDWEAPAALLLLDIDHFKDVNDTLGHAAGDALLRIAAGRLGERARPGELLARLGGDEFGLLITSLPVTVAEDTAGRGAKAGGDAPRQDRPASLRYALRRARELTEALAEPTEVAGVRLSVEASVGVVVAPAREADVNELLRRADIAMYQAKKGGAPIAWYDGAHDAGSTDRLALLAELREALAAEDQLVLALQPAVDLATGAPTGVEALIRWKHPRRGQLGPADFVRAVENSELLSQFTRYVIDKALTAAAEWARHGLDVPVAVNLSARNLLDPQLPTDVAALLHEHRLPPHRLIVEITETVVMSELEVVDQVLAELRALGVGLSVDDFGTGYSSLTFLTRISVDEVKVDRRFVRTMADSPEAAAIVRTTVDLARELGLRVVAEGVETADQRAALTALGCTAAQGFHFFKPMPAEHVVGVLRSLAANAQANDAQGKVVRFRADGAS
ncbi:MAG: bifunctional diguanylate cyclase/phosphodiesterase [Micromonosporaceae bacterium]|nr:bifunctional diguanylate cyclase/phosphodiesterase [Micromonosporaceae bacterium]